MNEVDLLSHVYQTAEMGRDGIFTVLKRTDDPALLKALNRQAGEYRDIQNTAERMLRARGVQPDGVGLMARVSSEMMGTMKVMADHSPSKVAEMMIQGSTMGVTKSLRTIRACRVKDGSVSDLADKLLRTEQANIEEMKGFL